jgi:hypothetical protein
MAHGSFNNGNAPVSKILDALGKIANYVINEDFAPHLLHNFLPPAC